MPAIFSGCGEKQTKLTPDAVKGSLTVVCHFTKKLTNGGNYEEEAMDDDRLLK